MKKVKFTGKLSLNKETVAKLNDDQMKHINGGAFVDAMWSRKSQCAKRPCLTGGIGVVDENFS